MKLMIDTCPNNEEFFAIWTNKKGAINCTVAKGIGDKEDAKIILKALQKKYDKI